VLPRSVELSVTETPFPAMTQIPTTAGITPNTSTMHLHTGAAPRSTFTSLEAPQTSMLTPIDPTSSSGLGEHRASIQTTVDELKDLVERLRVLTVEAISNLISNSNSNNIPPITQSCRNGLLGRGVSPAS
jgi:hypothetical protein